LSYPLLGCLACSSLFLSVASFDRGLLLQLSELENLSASQSPGLTNSTITNGTGNYFPIGTLNNLSLFRRDQSQASVQTKPGPGLPPPRNFSPPGIPRYGITSAATVRIDLMLNARLEA
jgi:hypothetical protein